MKMTTKTRKSINAILYYDFSKQYFKEIPLTGIFNTLAIHGVTAIQEDGTPWSGFLCGERATVQIELAIEGEVVKNSILSLSWYKMESGNYEINTYVS